MAATSIAWYLNELPDNITRKHLSHLFNAVLADDQLFLNQTQGVLTGTVTYDPPSLTTLLTTTTNVPVTGAVMGDFVIAQFGITMAGVTLTGYVSAPGVVTCVFDNGTSGTVDLASSTLIVAVFPKSSLLCSAGTLQASVVYDSGSLTTQTQALATVTVRGAALGDFVMVSSNLSLLGFTVTGYVSAADTVKIVLQNNTSGTIDLVSTTYNVRVIQDASFARFGVVAGIAGVLGGTATYDAGSLTTLTGETTNITVTGAAVGDFVMVAHGIDQAGIYITGYVSATNTVTVRVQNGTSGTVNLLSATITARTIPRAGFPASSVISISS